MDLWQDTLGLEELMLNLLLSSSCHDLISENSYHVLSQGFFSGVFFDYMWDVSIKTSRTLGQGKFDIVIVFANVKKVILFELKIAQSMQELKPKSDEALLQIENNNNILQISLFTIAFLLGYPFSANGLAYKPEQFSADNYCCWILVSVWYYWNKQLTVGST